MAERERAGFPQAWFSALIDEICAGPENALQGPYQERAWAEPLLGYARGDDPLFVAYREHVGLEHWTPLEAMHQAYPEESFGPQDLAVLSWVLPQTAATKDDNGRATLYPAERWARSRYYGEAFNDVLRQRLVEALHAAGIQAVSPFLLPGYHSVASERYVYASTWSERHIAHAAGLGTFGLCDGLITPVGKAVRLGSVIARVPVEPATRPYDDHHAYCLHYARRTCGVCMQRCPVGAITPQGHDKRLCRAHLDSTRPYVREQYGFDGYACGLCQTGTPCESGIPDGLR